MNRRHHERLVASLARLSQEALEQRAKPEALVDCVALAPELVVALEQVVIGLQRPGRHGTVADERNGQFDLKMTRENRCRDANRASRAARWSLSAERRPENVGSGTGSLSFRPLWLGAHFPRLPRPGASQVTPNDRAAARCAFIFGHGKSGTKRLLRISDCSQQTHCRNEPYNSPGSPWRELRPKPQSWVMSAQDEAGVAAGWEDAIEWCAPSGSAPRIMRSSCRRHFIVRAPASWGSSAPSPTSESAGC